MRAHVTLRASVKQTGGIRKQPDQHSRSPQVRSVFLLRCLCSCDYSPRRSKQREEVPTVSNGFREFFQTATNCTPYDYQRRLAGDPTVADAIVDGPKSLAINVPTGAGKTAAAVRMLVPRSAVEAGGSVRG